MEEARISWLKRVQSEIYRPLMFRTSCFSSLKGRSFPLGENQVCIFRVNALRPLSGGREAESSSLELLGLLESGESREVGREGVTDVFRPLKSSVFSWLSKPEVEPLWGVGVTVVASLNAGI